jgi:ParB family chromosome partitioning protein
LGALLTDPAFREADSDQRFVRVFNALAPKRAKKPAKTTLWRDLQGRKVAAIERTPQRVTIMIDKKNAPEFGEFLVARLPEIHAEFERRGGE